MKILSANSFTVIGTGATPKLRCAPDGSPRLVEGKEVYAVGGLVIHEGKELKGAYFYSFSPDPLKLGKAYKTRGNTYVTPWTSGKSSFINYSIVGELEEALSSTLPERPKGVTND